MNKGTDENILIQLGITSDQFGMITILYTVSKALVREGEKKTQADVGDPGPLHPGRNPVKLGCEESQSVPMAIQNYDNLVSSCR